MNASINTRSARSLLNELIFTGEEEKAFRSESLDTGKRTVYAVDYNEIFAYCHVGQSFENLLFYDQFDSSDFLQKVAFNEVVSKEILFSGKYTIAMLPSHRLELRRLASLINLRDFVEASEVFTEAEHVLFDPPSQRFRRLVAVLRRRNDNYVYSPDFIRNLITEMSIYAPSLLILSRREHYSPRKRLRKIIDRAVFSSNDTFFKKDAEPPNPKDDTYESALHHFTKIRSKASEASNSIDAYAVSYLNWANEAAKEGIQFRLISRSSVMHRVVRELCNDGVLSGGACDWLRHPRTFGVQKLQSFTHISGDNFWGSRFNSQELFSKSLETYLSSGRHGRRRDEALSQGLEQIHKDNHNIARILIQRSLYEDALQSEGEYVRSPEIGDFFDFKQLFMFLKHQSELDAAIDQKIRGVLEKFNEDTATLYSNLTINERELERLSKVIEFDRVQKSSGGENDDVAVVVADTDENFAYRLEFYSIMEFGGGEKKELKKRLRRFIRRAARVHSLEAIVAFSFLLGIRGEWKLAFSFLNQSIKQYGDTDDRGLHEAHYFRAVCRRYSEDRSFECAKRCIEDLELAAHHKLRVQGGDNVDERYLNEAAINLSIAELIGQPIQTDIFTYRKPIEIWRKLKSAASNEVTFLQYQNNICFYFVDVGDRGTVKKELADLLRAKEIAARNGYSISVFVDETIARARLLVGDYENEGERLRLLDIVENFARSKLTPGYLAK